MTSHFHIGQHVQVISPPDFNDDLVGRTGEVVDIGSYPLPILVRFDDDFVWWCEEESLASLFVGPPAPYWYKVNQKCKMLWNRSKWVHSHPKYSY